MTSIPLNLTLIREDFQKPRSLFQIRASMLAAPTDYVMVVGKDDIVVVLGDLTGEVHYLATHVATRRAFRYSWPVVAYDPVLLTQFNCLGFPILHKSLVPLFPEAAVEPWHTVMVRAQSAGASFSLVAGDHSIIEPWPRPERSGAYAPYRYSFDPAAVMAAVPTILVEEIDQQSLYTLRDSRADTVKAFCRGCSSEFLGSLTAPGVSVETTTDLDFDRIRAANTTYVAWFDGIVAAVSADTLSHMQTGLAFPGVLTTSPHLVADFTPATYHRGAFEPVSGITQGLSPHAWMSRTRDLGLTVPTTGYTTGQAILSKVP